MRFNHVARIIVNANHGVVWAAVEFRVAEQRVSSDSHLCQNRDPIANLGNLHGGPIRHDTDFNTHFDPLIFIVPVGLDGVDIDRELPPQGLYAYDLGSY